MFIFITNTDFDPPKRLIILSHENRTHLQQSQLPTPPAIMHQIPTNFQIDNEITTPLTGIADDTNSQPQTMELKSFPILPYDVGIFPSPVIFPNHRYDFRRRLEQMSQPRPFDYLMRGTPPTGFQRIHPNSSNFPQIPKDYEGTVNSIQDILKQMNDHEESSNGMHKIKIAGTYKHRKLDDVTGMFKSSAKKHHVNTNDEPPPVTPSQSINGNAVVRDPFYKYKPLTLSDVNLMATNQFRFAPYNVLSNKYIPMTDAMDPGNLYHQIIMANKNRLKYLDDNSKNDNVQSKQKPFTLMLDVYPMPDEEHAISSTSSVPMIPVKYQNHFNPHTIRHPGIGPINNLQYPHNSNYPQLNANRYPNLPHYHNPNYFRKFNEKPFKAGFFASNDQESVGNNPSQITVHLNLFPKKKERTRSAEIFSKNDQTAFEEGDPSAIRLQERMSKVGAARTNLTEEGTNTEPTTVTERVSNKVDMDVMQSTTIASVKQNKIIVIDDSADSIDRSSEDIFNREFLQFQATDSPVDYSSDDPPTFDSKSDKSSQLYVIPTVLPIEPRDYNSHQSMRRRSRTTRTTISA